MKFLHLKFTHKFILLISFLIIIVSFSLTVASTYLARNGKMKVRKGVTEKLEALRKGSMEEFGKFTEVADNGIAQASGLVST